MDNETLEVLRDNIDMVAELSLLYYDATNERTDDIEKIINLTSIFMGTILYHE